MQRQVIKSFLIVVVIVVVILHIIERAGRYNMILNNGLFVGDYKSMGFVENAGTSHACQDKIQALSSNAIS